jgi:high-affinity nickel-transport protein
MLGLLRRTLHPGTPLRRRIIGIYAGLTLANLAVWVWAVAVFRDQPALLGTALLAYGFGLRHAVDADHIAAIDNATRKLMQSGRRPVGVGLFFALGHSTVVILVAAGVACTATALSGSFAQFKAVGELVGTGVSALFLFAIAAVNLIILRDVWRTFRHVRQGGRYAAPEFDQLLEQRGLYARLFRPLFRIISESWHMYPLGFLFGLGFDTATEIALLAVAATAAAKAVSISAIMVFPALFAAGMSLVDTGDGILMLGAYDWGVRQADAQALLQPDHHPRVGRGRGPDRRYRDIGIARRSVRTERSLLGPRWGAQRQFHRSRDCHCRPVPRRLGRLGHRLPLSGPRRDPGDLVRELIGRRSGWRRGIRDPNRTGSGDRPAAARAASGISGRRQRSADR